jgi:hypothetical protein
MIFKFLKMVLTTCIYAMCISLGVLSVSGTASATLIESIAALEENAMYRVLFVTSSSRDATSSSITDYNDFVSTAAASGSVTGSLGLTWKALASTSGVNAQMNTGVFNSDFSLVTMFNTAGEIVATTGANFWEAPLNFPISYTEDAIGVASSVHTGTESGGTGGAIYALGNTYSINADVTQFTQNCYIYCEVSLSTNQLSLYGVSAIVLKPQADVPEPGTVILLSLGLACLSFARYRRQS